MDHARLRDATQKCRAAKTLLEQGVVHPNSILSVALDAVVELAEAVAADAPAGDQGSVRQLNLGEVIALLEAWPKKDDACRFDFGGLEPTKPRSYRGYYDQLAIGFGNGEGYPEPTVAMVLKELKDAVGKVFEGYKGGDYEMDERTPVWVANWGETSGTVIVGHYADHHHFMFKTTNID